MLGQKGRIWGLIGVALLLSSIAAAQGADRVRVEAEPVACIPIGGNALAYAQVENNVADTDIRLYFRRLHDVVEDFYWVDMQSEGDGRYWGVFPKAEDEKLNRHDLERDREAYQRAQEEAGRSDDDDDTTWADWWRAKDASDDRDPNGDLDEDLIRERASIGKSFRREWMEELDDAEFQAWLEDLVNEPAEYFVAVVDSQGRFIERTPVDVTEVLQPDNCDPVFTPQQAGEKENLTVGESGEWQRGKEVFHWLCKGVVTRVDPFFIKRPDEVCRACVVAWWQKKEILLPLVAVPPAIVITQFDPDPVSPSAP